MQEILFPDITIWPELLKRPFQDDEEAMQTAREIMHAVKKDGDAAVKRYEAKFGGNVSLPLRISEAEIAAAKEKISNELKQAILQAKSNIEAFHKAQIREEQPVETMPGVVCWRKTVGIERVGLYVPGGSAPLFSTVLMLGVPARLAGCRDIILCTPANAQGEVHPAILFAADLAGIGNVYRTGGAQAIAALTYGTESIPSVYKIFGPGNRYVTAAKQLAQQAGVAIDMPAGPSEVCVFADETGHPDFIAADLLSQAEHGPDSQVVLITTSEDLLKRVSESVAAITPSLSRSVIALQALNNSKAIVVISDDEALRMINQYAPEHLILACRNADQLCGYITNAGSVFIGNYTPETAGDYASGTNHTLPTNGYAKAYSGVSVDSFTKKISFQKITEAGLQKLGPTLIEMAREEQLTAHAVAVEIRLQQLDSSSDVSLK